MNYYIILPGLFFIAYLIIARILYYKKVEKHEITTAIYLSVIFTLVYVMLQELSSFLPINRQSELSILIAVYLTLVASEVIEVPGRYFRRVSSIFLAIIVTLIIMEIIFILTNYSRFGF